MTNGPQQVQRAEQAAIAIKMRNAGMSYEAIAQSLNIAKATAWRIATKALKELPAEDVETLRQVEGRRLEAIWAAFYPKAMDGDVDAAGVLIRVSNGRRRLFGLDAAGPVDGAHGVVIQQIVMSPALAMQPTPLGGQYRPPSIEAPEDAPDPGSGEDDIVEAELE
jgi:hypothetical protein